MTEWGQYAQKEFLKSLAKEGREGSSKDQVSEEDRGQEFNLSGS